MKKPTTQLYPFRALAGAAFLAAAIGAALLPAPAGAQEVEPASAPATVNINSADPATLAEALSGVGSSRAEAIVRYREMYGPFESVEELAEVSGVGSTTLERNRERITLE
ncbi:ComEA family DNA-binding protein [Pseudohaliea rubra]|uniref:DNA uptake protein n=1 Tax=Pseudohaliea rubra DSM 19751 TaxID=1265313 RepID=A0A095VQB4_9GAMM|nr:helix-hairpin-helix domain-containing protein [Pseudohaliea rubra]KGE03318.1 DNA uptake protein [Pseudohaliea rubra DSM 19751]